MLTYTHITTTHTHVQYNTKQIKMITEMITRKTKGSPSHPFKTDTSLRLRCRTVN